jgi:hypothetical protein
MTEARADRWIVWAGLVISGYFIWKCAEWVIAGLPGLLK